MLRTVVAVLGAVVILGAGCGGPTVHHAASSPAPPHPTTAPRPAASPSSAAPATPVPSARRYAHIVVVVLENKSFPDIATSPDATYLRALAARGALFTRSYAVTHPSQPNYLALFSGSTQGVTDDSCPQTFGTGTLAGQLRAAGRTFAAYSEGLPATGFTGCSAGSYARKHAPWADFPAVPAGTQHPFGAFPADPAALPTVSFVVPNLCDDMHDCPIATGDAWLRTHLDAYARWARTHDSLLVTTFDEDDQSAGNRIWTSFTGQGVRPGRYAERVDHYRVLRTVESLEGLPALGDAARTTPVTDVFGGSGGAPQRS
ncbi:alkaline phosphatase family protein [Actinocatenispora rupis]|uniref:Acid phosphatase n=1 Tax=Actinocatenispora rupis TaxID=519421 RepID=A0A8J3J7A7_9ACTN|nr:alkaline phosphatase family protein [Actinocatenispora rupis]GID09753.1 acid phosphatase [Actinocatenispora rupis]